MAKRTYNEDLFESTKMSFGDHLEELRKCFFRAGFGLIIGMSIGLYFAADIVKFIQTPLTSALTEFYKRQSEAKLMKYAADQLGGVGNAPAEILARLHKGEETFEMYLWDREEIKRALALPADAPPVIPSGTAMALMESAQRAADKRNENPATNTETTKAEEKDRSTKLAEQMEQVELPPLHPMFLWRKVADDPRVTLKSLSAQESFMIWLKAGFVFGAIVSSPWVLLQVWTFVAAGLYPHEKGYIYVFLPFSLALFLSGAALAFFIVFKYVLEFLLDFNVSMGIDPDPRISEWMSFVILMPLGFGVSFQLPLVMLFLERLGILSVGLYTSKWRISVLVIAALSALLTPGQDPYSMMFMFVPLVLLFFLGIGLCKWMPRNSSPFEEPAV